MSKQPFAIIKQDTRSMMTHYSESDAMDARRVVLRVRYITLAVAVVVLAGVLLVVPSAIAIVALQILAVSAGAAGILFLAIYLDAIIKPARDNYKKKLNVYRTAKQYGVREDNQKGKDNE